jgi:hypothetical protein
MEGEKGEIVEDSFDKIQQKYLKNWQWNESIRWIKTRV